MVIPERVTPSGVVLAEKKLHAGLGFEEMFDVYSYEGLSEEQTRKRYFRHPAQKENQAVPIVDASLTDKFSMSRIRVSGTAEADLSDSYAVAVATEGNGTVLSDGKRISLKKGDNFFVSACAGPLYMEGNMELVFCISH
jgi:mannose-6-phosphate isomerase